MRLFSRADLARLRRVTAAAVTKQAKKWPAAAFHAGRVDADYPDVKAWLQAGGVTEKQTSGAAGAPTAKAKAKKKRAAAPTPAAPPPVRAHRAPPPPRPDPPPTPPLPPQVPLPEDIKELHEYRALLAPLLDRFGTNRNFNDWLDAVKKIEDILAKHLGNEETQRRLISRDLVQNHVFGALGAMTRKLLRDSPKTIARKLYALAKSDRPIEEGERVVRENLSSQFVPMKDQAAKALRNA